MTIEEQKLRKLENKGRLLAIEIKTPGKDILRARDAFSEGYISKLSLRVDRMRNKQIIPETLIIPAGSFIMGSNDWLGDKKPERNVHLSRFAIGKYEVTNFEYKAYLEATGQRVPKWLTSAELWHPVVNVSWYNAVKYCEWLSKYSGRQFTLPTEAQGEYAARGTDGRKYPWGNEWDGSKLNFHTISTTPVDDYPQGASPFGVMDLSGNVMEWRWDFHEKYDPNDLWDPRGPLEGTHRIARGGAYNDRLEHRFETTERDKFDPNFKYLALGFRVAEIFD